MASCPHQERRMNTISPHPVSPRPVSPRPVSPRPVDAVIAAASAFLGERITVNAAIREQHSHGEDSSTPTLPDAVAFVSTTEEVSRLLALCHQHSVPVVPFGAGTSLEGHVNPIRAGISLDLSRMTAVLEVNEADMDCLIEPGVTRQQLNEHLRDKGMFFPVDPGSHCTLGGMVATRASGTNAVRYGTIRENTLGLEVVLADGRVVTTGGRTRKAANGYDLTRLFIGSEGTLGVVTKIRLRLTGIPEAMSSAVVQFPTLAAAVESTIQVMQLGIPVARIELLDDDMMAAAIAFSKLEGFEPVTTLFLEFHGTEAGVAEQAALVEAITTENGGSGFRWETDPAARTKLWKARHDSYWAGVAWIPGRRALTTDVCVPISRLAEALVGAKEEAKALGHTTCIVGHVGDGNFHQMILYDPADPNGLEGAWDMDRRVVARGLSLGGTCSGEHGIGLGKRDFLEAEHGADALDVMRSLKVALDPRGIMNPGKMFRN
jgi:D-lactate dehydrogenase (cytochrome)